MLELRNVSLSFNRGSVNQKEALRDVSVSFHKGDFVTVIGSNGAGKSTLLNIIAGVYLPDSGNVSVEGQDITQWADYRRAKFLGRVFQDPMKGTASNMMIEENLAMAYRRGRKRGLGWGITHKERELYRGLLKNLGLGLEDRLKTKAGLLSGGQRQALTLVMASLVEPKALLLDEHTAALDPKTAMRVMELTEEVVKQYNMATIMVTHNMKDALRYGNRLLMMHEGRMILDISGQEKKNYKVSDLLQMFERASGNEFVEDRFLLS